MIEKHVNIPESIKNIPKPSLIWRLRLMSPAVALVAGEGDVFEFFFFGLGIASG